MIEVDFTIDRFERIKLDLIRYPAGEIGYRLPYEEAITQIIVTPEITGGKSSLLEDVMAAKMLSDHFPDALVTFTYLPCSREDRRVSPNASYGLKSIANMFAGRKVLTIDQHSDGGEFNNAMATKAIANAIYDYEPTVLAFPDAGAKSRYLTLLKGIYDPEEHKIVYGEKVRNTLTGEIVKYELVGDLPEHAINPGVLVIDDICDGGRTFIELAKVIKAKNEKAHLGLYVTHGIFSKGLEELKTYYEFIYTTNTIKTDYTTRDLSIFNWKAL